MVVLLAVYGVTAVLGIVVLIVSAARAPEGYQNKDGFNYGSNEMLESSESHPGFSTATDQGSGLGRAAARQNLSSEASTSRVYTRGS